MLAHAVSQSKAQDVAQWNESPRRTALEVALGVLADARGLYQRLTSRENIRYYGNLHGLEGEALEEQKRVLFPAKKNQFWAYVACTTQ